MISTDFFEKLSKLSTGDTAVLKRNCGKMLNDADGKAIVVFYQCLPYGVPVYQESRWFAAACIFCLIGEKGTTPIEKCFAGMRMESDSIENRISTLMDLSWDDDGYCLSKLSRLVKMAVQKGYSIDCEALLEDLIYWNNSSKSVQKKWARALYYVPEETAKGEN